MAMGSDIVRNILRALAVWYKSLELLHPLLLL
jgi:hypothetical protein